MRYALGAKGHLDAVVGLRDPASRKYVLYIFCCIKVLDSYREHALHYAADDHIVRRSVTVRRLVEENLDLGMSDCTCRLKCYYSLLFTTC